MSLTLYYHRYRRKKIIVCPCKWDAAFENHMSHTRPSAGGGPGHPFDLDSNEYQLIKESLPAKYIAVSYRWRNIHGDRTPLNTVTRWQPKEDDYLSTVIHRAAKFAHYYGYRLLWIDQKSIRQYDDADKAVAVEAMDVVYQTAAVCLAVLEYKVKEQDELDALAYCLEICNTDHFLDDSSDTNPSLERLMAIVELLAHLIQDEYFERLWITQEHNSAIATVLLIRCAPDMRRPLVLGQIEDEIQVPFCMFMRMIDYIMIAVPRIIRQEAESQDEKRSSARGLWKALKNAFDDEDQSNPYLSTLRMKVEKLQLETSLMSILQRNRGPEHVHGRRYTCCAFQAISTLAKKKSWLVHDRLTVIANLCKYPLRLNANSLRRRGYDLAVCAFSLAIFNGDLSLAWIPEWAFHELPFLSWKLSNWRPVWAWESRFNDKVRYHIILNRGQDPIPFLCGWVWRRSKTLDLSYVAHLFEGSMRGISPLKLCSESKLLQIWQTIQMLRELKVILFAEALLIALLTGIVAKHSNEPVTPIISATGLEASTAGDGVPLHPTQRHILLESNLVERVCDMSWEEFSIWIKEHRDTITSISYDREKRYGGHVDHILNGIEYSFWIIDDRYHDSIKPSIPTQDRPHYVLCGNILETELIFTPQIRWYGQLKAHRCSWPVRVVKESWGPSRILPIKGPSKEHPTIVEREGLGPRDFGRAAHFIFL
jgi:hypothetical protein